MFKPVEFHPDGIGGFTKFSFQASEVTPGLAVEENLE
jgi:hypothetical protein